MKKIIILAFALFLNISFAHATDWNSDAALKRVNAIGSKILKANNVNQDITFKVSAEADINAYANINKEIYVYKGLLEYVDNDEELAGVISHEMGHIINGHCAKQGVLNATIATVASAITTNETVNAVGQHLTASKISRNDEFEADLTGVDLMSKAGYNPLAMISLLNKISGNYIDILQTHPSGEKRLLNVYEYVEYNNPNAIKKGFNSDSYEKSLIVINQTVEKRKNNERLTKKYVKKQEKLLKKKEKRAKKMQSKSTIWDGYYTTLQYLAS